jgi:hypothetical protein
MLCLLGLCPAALIILLLFAAGCGGKRNVPADDLDQPTTMPREQVLYREARSTLSSWLGIFDNTPPGEDHFRLITERSRKRLAGMGIYDAAAFARWFSDLRSNGASPFRFRISRVDILDVDITDTMRARITATFVLESDGRMSENLGLFTLVREQNAWKIPFGESDNWQKSWCDLERESLPDLSERDMRSHLSTELGLIFQYPVSWDVNQPAPFNMPEPLGGRQCISLRYNDPNSGSIGVLLAMCEVPLAEGPSQTAPLDTAGLNNAMVVRSTQSCKVNAGAPLAGKLFWLQDPVKNRFIAVYAGVNPSTGSYSNFSQVIDAVVRSIRSTW